MSMTTTYELTCDECGNGCVMGKESYGWIALHPQHMYQGDVGHNKADIMKMIVLCPTCWPKEDLVSLMLPNGA